MFVDTATADDNYSLCKKENLPPPIQMQLSKKQNTFSELFAPFLKSTLNFKHFRKNR